MKIIVDAMGGDFAPLAPVKGALMAQEKYGVDIVLTGKTEEILKALQRAAARSSPRAWRSPTRPRWSRSATIRRRPLSTRRIRPSPWGSICCTRATRTALSARAARARSSRARRFSSSASAACARAALAPTIPTAKGKAVLIDCGANAECTVEYLLQFAYLGSYYAQKVLGVENPRIGLLNIGAEESKGDTLRRETYQKLKEAGEAGHLNFTGNIEAKEAMLGECDVIVADGYSGNIMLKSIEGTGKLLSIKLKEMLMHSTGTKLAALLLKGQLGDFKKMLDANEVGGTALLGISKPVVKAHGSASEVGICNAVRQAMEVARSGIIDDIAQNIDKMRIEQKAE